MNMNKENIDNQTVIFAVSDVHGHYTALMQALEESGFDAGNENHVFLSLGDLADRGTENVKVYEFVKSLPRKILLKGNHEDMLRDILTGGEVSVTDIYNGTDITVAELLGEEAIDKYGFIDLYKYEEKIAETLSFLDSMENYFEFGDYVFTHGWLPCDIDLAHRKARVLDDWRNATEEEWSEARWLSWKEMYAVGAMLAGKTVVCGHRPARMGDTFDPMRERDCDDIFYGDGVIAIDAYTIRSGKVNVLRISAQ